MLVLLSCKIGISYEPLPNHHELSRGTGSEQGSWVIRSCNTTRKSIVMEQWMFSEHDWRDMESQPPTVDCSFGMRPHLCPDESWPSGDSLVRFSVSFRVTDTLVGQIYKLPSIVFLFLTTSRRTTWSGMAKWVLRQKTKAGNGTREQDDAENLWGRLNGDVVDKINDTPPSRRPFFLLLAVCSIFSVCIWQFFILR